MHWLPRGLIYRISLRSNIQVIGQKHRNIGEGRERNRRREGEGKTKRTNKKSIQIFHSIFSPFLLICIRHRSHLLTKHFFLFNIYQPITYLTQSRDKHGINFSLHQSPFNGVPLAAEVPIVHMQMHSCKVLLYEGVCLPARDSFKRKLLLKGEKIFIIYNNCDTIV